MHHALQKCVTKTQDDYFEYRQFYIAVFSFCRLLFSKSYMRFKSWSFKDRKRSIQRIVSDLEMLLLYVHVDEIVYSKLCRIIWQNPELYNCTVILTGVFHKIRVKRWLIYKCFNYIGIKEWRIHGVKTLGTAAQAMKGHHYYICVHLYKKFLDKLVQFRFEKVKGYLFFSKFSRSIN